MEYDAPTWGAMSYKVQQEILANVAKREREKKEAQLYLEIVVKDQPPKGDPPDGSGGHVSTAPDGGSPSACAPLGLLGLSPALVTKVSKWKRSTQTALVDLCTDFASSSLVLLSGSPTQTC